MTHCNGPFPQTGLPSPTNVSVPAMVKLALWAPGEVGTDGGAQPPSPAAHLITRGQVTLTYDISGTEDQGGGAGPRADAPHTPFPHQPECKLLAKRFSRHYLQTKMLRAGGLCISALSVRSTCSVPAAPISFCHGHRSQWEHNGPTGQGQGSLSLSPSHQSPSPPPSPGARSEEVVWGTGRRGNARGGEYRSLA